VILLTCLLAMPRALAPVLFDHLVRAQHDRWGDGKTKCLGGQRRGFSSGSFSSPEWSTPMRRTRVSCCARATSGHAAAPPTAARNSRRRRQMLTCPSVLGMLHEGRIARSEAAVLSLDEGGPALMSGLHARKRRSRCIAA